MIQIQSRSFEKNTVEDEKSFFTMRLYASSYFIFSESSMRLEIFRDFLSNFKIDFNTTVLNFNLNLKNYSNFFKYTSLRKLL